MVTPLVAKVRSGLGKREKGNGNYPNYAGCW